MNRALTTQVVNGTVHMEWSDFLPIPQLSVSDADLMLVFLSAGGVLFFNHTDDPWYRGIIPSTTLYYKGDHLQLYAPDEAASPMGCLQRFQYCNSNMKCGSLASNTDAQTSASSLFHLTPGEFSSGLLSSHGSDGTPSRFEMFLAVLSSSGGIPDLITSLGSSSLLSSQHFGQGVMGPLPNNQWQLDVIHWFAIRMASLQAASVNTARGLTDEALLPYVSGPSDEHQWTMCNNQVRNDSII